MYKYQKTSIYRGIQIHVICIASSDKKASEKLGCSVYEIRTYAYKNETDEKYDEVMAYIDGGKIINEFGRDDLHFKVMPIKDLKHIIDVIIHG